MKKKTGHKRPVLFFETVTQEARNHPVRALSITDEENVAPLGLVLFDEALEEPRAAHLLRKTALSLSCACDTGDAAPPSHTDCGQVTVEERAQLFNFSRK